MEKPESVELDEVGTYMVTDAVCGIIHAALDLGLSMEDIERKIEIAIDHAKTERKLLENGECTQCGRSLKKF